MGENMTDVLLRVENLHVSVGDTPIIQGISLEIKRGEIHAIMGRNGAGKSTLANVVMGHPAYEVTSGTIHYKGQNIDDMEVFERARAGMFLSFQYPFFSIARWYVNEFHVSVSENKFSTEFIKGIEQG